MNFNNIAIPTIKRIKNDIELRQKTKIEPNDLQAIFDKEKPQVNFSVEEGIKLEFENCTLTIDINSLCELAKFKSK
jgi:predicted component of type VI protein secretion system